VGRVETHLRACLNKAGAKIPVDRSAGAIETIRDVDFDFRHLMRSWKAWQDEL
jgi:hypothetical protein